jgi:hypothetical protein
MFVFIRKEISLTLTKKKQKCDLQLKFFKNFFIEKKDLVKNLFFKKNEMMIINMMVIINAMLIVNAMMIMNMMIIT